LIAYINEKEIAPGQTVRNNDAKYMKCLIQGVKSPPVEVVIHLMRTLILPHRILIFTILNSC
jgi:hypothetical protein